MKFHRFFVFGLILMIVGVAPACALQVPVAESQDFGHGELIFSHLSYLNDNVPDLHSADKKIEILRTSVVSENVGFVRNVSDGSSQLQDLVGEGDRLYPVVKSAYDKYCSKVDNAVKAHDTLFGDYKSVVADRVSAESALDGFELSTSNSGEYGSLKDRYDSLVCEENAIKVKLDKEKALLSELNQKKEYYRIALGSLDDLKNSKDVGSALRSVDAYKKSMGGLKQCDENINGLMVQSSSSSSVSSVDSVSVVDGVTVDSISDLSTVGMGAASDFNTNNSICDELTTLNTLNNDTNNTNSTNMNDTNITINMDNHVNKWLIGSLGVGSYAASLTAILAIVGTIYAKTTAANALEMIGMFTPQISPLGTSLAAETLTLSYATTASTVCTVVAVIAALLVVVAVVAIVVYIGCKKGWWNRLGFY